MSDLNELIATNASRAYHEGLDRGAAYERERIVEILDSLDIGFSSYEDRGYIVGDALDLIAIIRGEDK
jgi:hypothetical protein